MGMGYKITTLGDEQVMFWQVSISSSLVAGTFWSYKHKILKVCAQVRPKYPSKDLSRKKYLSLWQNVKNKISIMGWTGPQLALAWCGLAPLKGCAAIYHVINSLPGCFWSLQIDLIYQNGSSRFTLWGVCGNDPHPFQFRAWCFKSMLKCSETTWCIQSWWYWTAKEKVQERDNCTH